MTRRGITIGVRLPAMRPIGGDGRDFAIVVPLEQLVAAAGAVRGEGGHGLAFLVNGLAAGGLGLVAGPGTFTGLTFDQANDRRVTAVSGAG